MAAKKMGKRIWRRRRFLKRDEAQDILNTDIEAGRAPSGRKRATYTDATAMVMDKDPTEDLTTCHESLFVKEEDRAETKAAVDFCQNSWAAGGDENVSEANENSTGVLQQAIKHLKKRTQMRGRDHSRNSGSSVKKQKEALAKILNGKVQEPIRRRCHESSSGSLTKRNRSTIPGQLDQSRV